MIYHLIKLMVVAALSTVVSTVCWKNGDPHWIGPLLGALAAVGCYIPQVDKAIFGLYNFGRWAWRATSYYFTDRTKAIKIYHLRTSLHYLFRCAWNTAWILGGCTALFHIILHQVGYAASDYQTWLTNWHWSALEAGLGVSAIRLFIYLLLEQTAGELAAEGERSRANFERYFSAAAMTGHATALVMFIVGGITLVLIATSKRPLAIALFSMVLGTAWALWSDCLPAGAMLASLTAAAWYAAGHNLPEPKQLGSKFHKHQPSWRRTMTEDRQGRPCSMPY